MQGRNGTTYRIGLAAVLLLLAAILTATVMMTALAADETDDSKIHVVTVDVNPVSYTHLTLPTSETV